MNASPADGSERPLHAELDRLLRAPYGVVLLVSHEEGRVLRAIETVARALGIEANTDAPYRLAAEPGVSPEYAMLEHLQELLSTASANEAYIYLDPHSLLSDPRIVRKWREVAARLESCGATALWLSPSARVPLELEADVRVYDVPLPDPFELSQIVEQVLLERDLEYAAEQRTMMGEAARGLTAREAYRAVSRALLDWEATGAEVLAAGGSVAPIIAEKKRLIRQSEALEYVEHGAGLTALGGVPDLKHWLADRARAFGDEARAFGLPAPRGLLLVGVQGCGKSLTAKSVAAEWQLPLLRLDLGSVFGSSSGGDTALRQAMKVAESMAPAVLWIDEIEKGFAGAGSGDEEPSRLLGSLLTWLQEKTSPVFVVATANEVDQLPPELLRKGRFDELFFLDLPDAKERSAILQIHLEARERDPGAFDVPALVIQTEHFSGSEIEQVVISGLYAAFSDGRELTSQDLLVAAKETVPLYATYEERIKGLREWANKRARRANVETSMLDLFRKS